MSRPGRYPADVRARAVGEVRRLAGSATSEWAAINAAAQKLGLNTETLRRWVREDERKAAVGRGTDPTRAELRRLRQENADLRRAVQLMTRSATGPSGRPGATPTSPGETTVRTTREPAPKTT